jgi:CubicO group peptidase (beta-lactamase class C family)
MSTKRLRASAVAIFVLAFSSTAQGEIANPVFGAGPDCTPPPTRALEQLEEVVASVRTGEGAAVSATLDRVWSPEARNARAESENALIRWALANQDLGEMQVCAHQTTGVFALYRNRLTGLIDNLRVFTEEGGEQRVTGMIVRVGYRAEPDPGRNNDRARVARLDAFLDMLAERRLFSGVVLLARDGEPIYMRAGGVTGQNRTPIQTDDIFEMASSTKMFTAVAIFQLIEGGQLTLDTTLAQAAPSLVPAEVPLGDAERIQIRHLLSHTSGITDGSNSFQAPGQTYNYANSNFWLLGKIIEAASGMRYEDYLRLNVLGPLGMANTSRFEITRATDALVTGYMAEVEGGRLNYVANPLLQTIQGGAQGGYYSTADDMLRFVSALREGRLISREHVEAMRSIHPELGATEYGFGIVRWRGRGVWGHAGDLPGADVDVELYGDTPYSAIVLSNVDDGNDPIIAKIRALFFPEGGSGPPR